MTDNEILKALECCKDLKCSECPKKANLFVTDCDVKLCDEAVDLINRQKAQIEGLTEERERNKYKFDKIYNFLSKEERVRMFSI